MTSREYIDEIKVRMLRENVSMAFNDLTVLDYINEARRQVQLDVVPVMPERYARVTTQVFVKDEVIDYRVNNTNLPYTTRVYQAPLPDGFIEIYQTIVKWTDSSGVTYFPACRQITKQEMFAIQLQSINRPTTSEPVYCIERNQSANSWVIYLSGLDFDATNSIFEETNPELITWHTEAVPDLDLWDNTPVGNADNDIATPLDLEELIINYTLRALYEVLNATEALPSVDMQIKTLLNRVNGTYMIEKQEEAAALPSKEEN